MSPQIQVGWRAWILGMVYLTYFMGLAWTMVFKVYISFKDDDVCFKDEDW